MSNKIHEYVTELDDGKYYLMIPLETKKRDMAQEKASQVAEDLLSCLSEIRDRGHHKDSPNFLKACSKMYWFNGEEFLSTRTTPLIHKAKKFSKVEAKETLDYLKQRKEDGVIIQMLAVLRQETHEVIPALSACLISKRIKENEKIKLPKNKGRKS